MTTTQTGTGELSTISITRALKELKILEGRINSAIGGLTALDITQKRYKGKALRSNKPITEFETEAKQKYQAVTDLMLRRNTIKSALVKSNATTVVKVGKKEMTVAEAIDQKNFIAFRKTLLNNLRSQKVNFDKEIETSRVNLEQQISVLIQQNVGKDKKVDKDDYEKIAVPFMEANELHLVDPLKVGKIIEELDLELVEFEADIDIVLSESNSKTEISV